MQLASLGSAISGNLRGMFSRKPSATPNLNAPIRLRDTLLKMQSRPTGPGYYDLQISAYNGVFLVLV